MIGSKKIGQLLNYKMKNQNKRQPEIPREEQSQIKSKSDNALSRRSFLTSSAKVAGSIIAGTSILDVHFMPSALGKKTEKIDIAGLKKILKGNVLLSNEAAFKKTKHDLLWNQLQSERSPNAIVQVSNVEDIVSTIKYANKNKLKVGIRGGGHNWCGMAVRDGGLLIDLGNLNSMQKIDTRLRRCVTQPVVSNWDMITRLAKDNLAFPVGHCPGVKLSGYLLNGGLGWNQGAWGLATLSMEALNIVTADGEVLTASGDKNQEYFWAARGCGPGFFAIATDFNLKLYPMPESIYSSVYYFPLQAVKDVGDWLSKVADKLPDNVELSMFLISAPDDLTSECKANNGKVVMVTAAAYADSEKEAKNALGLLESGPVKPLSKSINQPTDLPKLMSASGTIWSPNLRNKAEAMWSNSSASELFSSVSEHFKKAPSKKSCIVYVFNLGRNKDKLPDMAYSMMGNLYGGVWTMWDEAKDDDANVKWHSKAIKYLKPHILGHYVGETDIVEDPKRAKESFKKQNWKQIKKLRKKFDPDGIFYDYTESIT